jgi:transcriptional regulator with XRE-family HTH domain
MTTTTELGTAIAARRRALELSQEQLAFVVGVNRRVIGELERGKDTVRLGIALRAVEALGLDIKLEART